MVAAATNNLCEAANSAVQGHASEEKLISSAKQVAASTAQLLVACKVKADQDSQTMKRLQVKIHKHTHTCIYMQMLTQYEQLSVGHGCFISCSINPEEIKGNKMYNNSVIKSGWDRPKLFCILVDHGWR